MKTALFFKLLFVCLACVAIRPVSAQVLGAGVFELKGSFKKVWKEMKNGK